MKLSDSIALPAILLFGQVIMFQRNGLPDDPAAARVTVGWTLFLVACLIQAIWLRKREVPATRSY